MEFDYRTLKYAIDHADGWVVRNLKRNNNSVFPSDLVTCAEDIEIWQRILSMVVKREITIRKTEGGYICETQ